MTYREMKPIDIPDPPLKASTYETPRYSTRIVIVDGFALVCSTLACVVVSALLVQLLAAPSWSLFASLMVGLLAVLIWGYAAFERVRIIVPPDDVERYRRPSPTRSVVSREPPARCGHGKGVRCALCWNDRTRWPGGTAPPGSGS